jgi:hypothetical protein
MENKDITTEFFNNFYNLEISYNPSEVDAVIGYFLKRGFENIAEALGEKNKLEEDGIKTEALAILKGNQPNEIQKKWW